jgi:hypothetical protein
MRHTIALRKTHSVFCGLHRRQGRRGNDVHHIFGAAALGVATLVGAGLSAPSAQAAYVVTLAQVGSNVVATGAARST